MPPYEITDCQPQPEQPLDQRVAEEMGARAEEARKQQAYHNREANIWCAVADACESAYNVLSNQPVMKCDYGVQR